MTIYECISLILTLFSIVAGPTVGIQLQKHLERKKADRDQKNWVFFTLMATRMERVGYEHVKALNSIILSFHTNNKQSREQKVLNKWKEYHMVLCDKDLKDRNNNQWLSTQDSRFIDLLYEMSQCLGYVYDRGEIEKGGYSPVAHGELEQNKLDINRGLAEIVLNKRPLWVHSTLYSSLEKDEEEEDGELGFPAYQGQTGNGLKSGVKS